MSFIVSIQDANGKVHGTGVVVARDLVLTCAHVVLAALQRRSEERPPEGAIVMLGFSAAPDTLAEAIVDANPDAWTEPPADESRGGDLCVLKLRMPIPAAVSIAQIKPKERHPRSFDVLVVGYPSDWNGPKGAPELDAAEARVLTSVGYLWLLRTDVAPAARNQRPAGLIYRGFSGAPLQDEFGEVVGIIAQARDRIADGTSYAIPASYFPDRLLPKPVSQPEQDLHFIPLAGLNFVHLGEEKYAQNGAFSFRVGFNLLSKGKRFRLLGFVADYIAPDGCYCLNSEQSLRINDEEARTSGNYRDFVKPISTSDAAHVLCGRKVRPPLMIQEPAECDYGDVQVSAHVFWEATGKTEIIDKFFTFKSGGELEPILDRREPPMLSDSLLDRAVANGWITAEEYQRATFIDAVNRYHIARFPDYIKQVHPKDHAFWDVTPKFREFILDLNDRLREKDAASRPKDSIS